MQRIGSGIVLACCFLICVAAASTASAQPTASATTSTTSDLTTDIVCATLRTETVETSIKRFLQRISGGPRTVAAKLSVATIGAALTFCEDLVAKARSVTRIGVSRLLGTTQPRNAPPIVFAPQERVRGEVVLPRDGFVPISVFWTAFDFDGVRAHDLEVFEAGNDTATELSARLDTIRNFEVEPGKTYRFTVRSQDRRGAWSGYVRGTAFQVDLVSEEDAGRSSGWSPHDNSDALDGSDRFASASGAWMSYRFHGDYVAWVGPTWLQGGTASVSVDGIRRATVDLSSSTTIHRQVLSAWQWPRPGAHEIVVEVESGGVEVDGFIVID